MKKILGIDTSCDDTSIAVVNNRFKILSNVVFSQIKIHQKYGGVFPDAAKRAHQKNLPIVLKQVIKELSSKENAKIVDAVAVTVGPGLDPCLWQGINFAKKLAKKWNVPIIPINHTEAHLIANFLNLKKRDKSKTFPQPAIGLVVSGGTTQLILIKKIGDYRLLGETRDDAAGECFDKTARILGLPYPGGPAIAKQAEKAKNPRLKIKLPRPMLYSKNFDFSFSGLKTAVLYDFRGRSKKIRKSKEYLRAMAREIQNSISDVLVAKTIKAAKQYGSGTILLGGGVSANQELRRKFKQAITKEMPNSLFLVPPPSLCLDNAAMIAATAFFHRNKATRDLQKIKSLPNLEIQTKKPIEL